MAIPVSKHQFAHVNKERVCEPQRRRPRRRTTRQSTKTGQSAQAVTRAYQERSVKKKKRTQPVKANGFKSESDFIKVAVEHMTWRGAVVRRVNSGMQVITDQSGKRRVFRGAEKGTSDLFVCFKGRFMVVETKMPGNHPTEEQLRFLEDVERAGGVAVVAYTMGDIDRAMDDIAQEQK